MSLKYIRYDIYPARGRKRANAMTQIIKVTEPHSLRYLPRKGTETLVDSFRIAIGYSIRYDIYPARGRKHGHRTPHSHKR